MASISIHWADLFKVAEVSLAFGVGIVVVFALGVIGLSRLDAARAGEASTRARIGGVALAGLAFAVCASAALYGLYLIVPQFHST